MTRPGGFLLTPGAGTDANHPSLVAIENGLAPLPVQRTDFPYRREGRKAPDRAPKVIAFLAEETKAYAQSLGVKPNRLLLGGRSFGGRMCSMAVAEGVPAMGLVLIAYPLHPPGKPDNLRVEHLPQLDLPCLFISGTKDPFGTPVEFAKHLKTIPGPVTQHWIEGKGHDLRGADAEVVATIKAWLKKLSLP